VRETWNRGVSVGQRVLAYWHVLQRRIGVENQFRGCKQRTRVFWG